MAQVVSRRPLTAEVWVHASVSSCEICGGQSGTRTSFSLSSSIYPCQYHSTIPLHTHHLGMNKRPVSDHTSETASPIDMNNSNSHYKKTPEDGRIGLKHIVTY
jgi:hypothetical protein